MEHRIRLLNKRSHEKGRTERKANAANSSGASLTSVESLREKVCP